MLLLSLPVNLVLRYLYFKKNSISNHFYDNIAIICCLQTVRHTTVDFNSLEMIVNVESWVVVLDFFGISDIDQESAEKRSEHQETHIQLEEQSSKFK